MHWMAPETGLCSLFEKVEPMISKETSGARTERSEHLAKKKGRLKSILIVGVCVCVCAHACAQVCARVLPILKEDHVCLQTWVDPRAPPTPHFLPPPPHLEEEMGGPPSFLPISRRRCGGGPFPPRSSFPPLEYLSLGSWSICPFAPDLYSSWGCASFYSVCFLGVVCVARLVWNSL